MKLEGLAVDHVHRLQEEGRDILFHAHVVEDGHMGVGGQTRPGCLRRYPGGRRREPSSRTARHARPRKAPSERRNVFRASSRFMLQI
jgi:hypothetical protein